MRDAEREGPRTAGSAEVSRRSFIAASTVAGAGLLLGLRIPPRRSTDGDGSLGSEAFAPNAWIRLDENGDITILVHKSEMGQGVWTALPMIVAEEMDADWRRVRAERAPTLPTYDTATGGSSSVRESWDALRKAGAAARAMLVTAAAKRWGVAEGECTTSASEVIHTPTRRRLAYGALATSAATVTVPDEKSLTLKDPRTYRIVGRDTPRLDTPAKVTGRASFGIDVKVPGMLVAVVARCPTYSGKVARVDDSKARAVAGVRQVIVLDPVPRNLPGRVAVLADDTWSAIQGRRALEIEWDLGDELGFSTEAMWDDARRLVNDDANAKVNRQWAGADTASRNPPGARVVEATYELPFVAHACMEPMNCTASVTAHKVDLWLPSQFPEQARRVASQLTKVPLENVEAHVTFLGGGFGRRAYQDFVIEAVELSQKAGAPVKVVWTREDDIQHDFYRPAQLQHFRAALDTSGRPLTWDNRVVGPSTEMWWNPKSTQPGRREGGEEPPYDVLTTRNDFVQVAAPVPLGAWRAVQNGQNGFCFESFVDECAHALRMDPVEYRIARLAGKPRQQAVVRLAAEKAGWGTKLPKGRGRGVAFFDYDGTYVAQVAEVTVTKKGVHVDRVVCAFDCGTIVNPDTVRAQAESAVVWATTAALYGEITVKDGRTVQSNFHDYPVMRMAEVPVVEVHLVRNFEAPTGVGEPAVPPLAAAIGNAIFAATSQRLRRLPFRLVDLNVAALSNG